VILAVSPVPFIATAVPGAHVLTSTVYSKSVLRPAREMAIGGLEGVAYFPSAEIITGAFLRRRYFVEDCRSVLQHGVDHMMRVFMRHFGEGARLGCRGKRPFPSVRINCEKLRSLLKSMATTSCSIAVNYLPQS
jgi:hypothetical protein